jgi:hypothetical protein
MTAEEGESGWSGALCSILKLRFYGEEAARGFSLGDFLLSEE